MKTLIIVDVQNDFMKGGSLEVPHAETIIPVINTLQPQFDLVIATQDWHPKNHKSFFSNHTGKKPFDKIILDGVEQTLWPDHCVQGSKGAEFYSELETTCFQAIFRKGVNSEIDSCSAFYDAYQKSTGLSGYLKERKVTDIYFCGLCADICIYLSIKDALQEGFRCFLIEKATFPLDKKKFQKN